MDPTEDICTAPYDKFRGDTFQYKLVHDARRLKNPNRALFASQSESSGSSAAVVYFAPVLHPMERFGGTVNAVALAALSQPGVA